MTVIRRTINNPCDVNDSDNDQDYIDENGDECDGDNCANDDHEIYICIDDDDDEECEHHLPVPGQSGPLQGLPSTVGPLQG